MADIKNTISFLCKHLNLLFDMNIKPEMFRLAKYNKSDDNVVETLWALLGKITQLTTSHNIVKDVKCYFLFELKYNSGQLYCLPENMSQWSRELLLALAYLIANGHLNKHVEQVIVNSPVNPNFQVATGDNNVNATENYSFTLKQLKNQNDFENAERWIEGRTEYKKRAISEYEECFKKMSEKISKTILTVLPDIEKLSLSEVLALSNVEHAQLYLEKTDRCLKIMQNHGRWLQNQPIFWKWMSSVIFETHKDAREINIEAIHQFLDTIN